MTLVFNICTFVYKIAKETGMCLRKFYKKITEH